MRVHPRLRRVSRSGRIHDESKKGRGNDTRRHPGKLSRISTFNGNHSEREIIAFNHRRISFAIPSLYHPFFSPSLVPSLVSPVHRLERPVKEECNNNGTSPPSSSSAQRNVSAQTETGYPAKEGWKRSARFSPLLAREGSTIEGRKGHGSRNLSSVAQHCCHGRFALSAERIDGGAECCWVRSLFLDACTGGGETLRQDNARSQVG